MSQKLDLYKLWLKDWRSFLDHHRWDMFTIDTVEGELELPGHELLMNMMICWPLIKRRQPLSQKRHIFLGEIFDVTAQAKCHTAIREDLFHNFDDKDIRNDILQSKMDAHNMCYTHLGSAIRTMDIFSLGDVVLNPDIEKVLAIDISKEKERGISAVEEKIQEQAKVVMQTLMSPKNKWSVLYGPLKCGVLKSGQFHQVIMMIGSRTDTDEYIFPYPMECSYLSGYRNETDLAVESRSGAKAGYYNKRQMPDTQYLNRRLQILGIDTHALYRGDCGSTKTLPYFIEEPYKKYYLGKYIVNQDGSMTILTRENIDKYVGTTQNTRTTGECLHPDGYCEVCGGTLTWNFPRNINVGTSANVESGAKVAQNVLSTKHFLMAMASEYTIPKTLEMYFQKFDNCIVMRRSSGLPLKKTALGFQPRDIARIEDVGLVKENSSVTPEYFSEIKYMNIGRINDDGSIESLGSRVAMKGDGGIYPYLSPEALSMIEQHPDCVVRDGKIVWIKLDKFDFSLPILKHTVINDSIKQFVKEYSNFVTKNIEKYTSYGAAVATLKDFLWKRKIDTHITHIETLIKSFLITGSLDFSVGVIDNPDNVRFGTLGRIIPRRSIGAQFVFERNREYMASPTVSTLPKKSGQFDEFMGFTDICERDRYWPPGSVNVNYHEDDTGHADKTDHSRVSGSHNASGIH